MRYFDTAYILKLYLHEDDSEAVMRGANESGGLACSALAVSEVHAAVHRGLREGRLASDEFEAVLARFHADVELGMWHWLPVSMRVLQRVAATYGSLPASVFLRSADAIHLATAATHGFACVYSTDRHLLAAAPHFGLRGIRLGA